MNDEQRLLLSAYHDDELDLAGHTAASELLQRDPEARAYLEGLQRADNLLHTALDPILDEPVPGQLAAVLRKRRRAKRLQVAVPIALAASVALVAVLLVRQGELDQRMNDQMIDMQQQIAQLRHKTLENIPSGTAASWTAPTGATRAEITPIKTYRSSDNQFCREYEERVEDAQGIEVRRGIACRTGKAQWPDLAESPAVEEGPGPSGGGKPLNL
jgi:surface antigen